MEVKELYDLFGEYEVSDALDKLSFPAGMTLSLPFFPSLLPLPLLFLLPTVHHISIIDLTTTLTNLIILDYHSIPIPICQHNIYKYSPFHITLLPRGSQEGIHLILLLFSLLILLLLLKILYIYISFIIFFNSCIFLIKLNRL